MSVHARAQSMQLLAPAGLGIKHARREHACGAAPVRRAETPAHACAAGLMVLIQSSAMLYECGPWCGCPDGVDCPQALTQQASSLVSALPPPRPPQARLLEACLHAGACKAAQQHDRCRDCRTSAQSGPLPACFQSIPSVAGASMQGLHWRLEVFQTAGRGWGVRSWVRSMHTPALTEPGGLWQTLRAAAGMPTCKT